MKFLSKINIVVFTCFLCLGFQGEQAEAKTNFLDSYYPSPFGAYEKLRLSPIDPTTATCDAMQLGMIFMSNVDETVQFCANQAGTPTWQSIGTLWTEFHGDAKNFSPALYQRHAISISEPDLKIGINTSTPRETFDVNGTLMTLRLQGNLSKRLTSFEARVPSSFAPLNQLYAKMIGWQLNPWNYFSRVQIDGATVLFNSRDTPGATISNPVTNTRNVGIGVYSTRNMLHVRDKIEAEEFRAKDGAGTNNQYAYMSASNVTGSYATDYVDFGGKNTGGAYVPTAYNASQIVIWESSSSVPFVGIGVTAPHADPNIKMQVAGGARMNELIMYPGAARLISITGTTTALKLDAVTTGGAHDILRIDGSSILFQNIGSGRVGIGMVPGAGIALDVNGQMRSTLNYIPSDARLKKDIRNIENALVSVSQLRGVYYRWKKEDANPGLKSGLIAQDVEKVYPEAVGNDDQGNKFLSYGNMVAPLIEAVKELKLESDLIEKRIQALETEL